MARGVPVPPQVPSAPRCNLLQLEIVGALLELLVLGLDGFAQFLQNLRWGEGETRWHGAWQSSTMRGAPPEDLTAPAWSPPGLGFALGMQNLCTKNLGGFYF